MTMDRREVLRNLAGCVQGRDQAEAIRAWSELPEKCEGPPLDDPTCVLLYASALGDDESWEALVARHPGLAGLDGINDMPAVIERLFC
jgi:hypothetical protein